MIAPADAAAADYVFVTFMVTEDGEQGHPMNTIVTRVDVADDGSPLSLDQVAERVEREVRRKVATRRGDGR